jgi:hypothetical protein
MKYVLATLYSEAFIFQVEDEDILIVSREEAIERAQEYVELTPYMNPDGWTDELEAQVEGYTQCEKVEACCPYYYGQWTFDYFDTFEEAVAQAKLDAKGREYSLFHVVKTEDPQTHPTLSIESKDCKWNAVIPVQIRPAIVELYHSVKSRLKNFRFKVKQWWRNMFNRNKGSDWDIEIDPDSPNVFFTDEQQEDKL